MSSIAGTPSAMQDLMETEAERTLWEVIRHHERPPYWHEGEGVGARLNRAARVITEGRITPNSDGSYTVEGSEGRTYRVAEACSCPQGSRYGRSKYCYHLTAVHIYIEWCRRLGHSADPGSQPGAGQPALPLPPTTVEERLAAPAAQEAQGDAMTEDAEAYIPEPDAAPVSPYGAGPVAVEERPTPEPAAVTPAVRAGHALLAPDDDLELALTLWTAQRQIVQRFLKHQLIAGTDYYQLRIGKGESKPSLSKAGAEKVLSWLKWSASFTPDTGTWEMLGRPTDVVCYVCHLHTRSGEVVGEGRGARSLKKDAGDINKAIKMAEKSSMVSAVLRTGALSDCFTQDLEDMQDPEPARPTPAQPSSQELRQRIWAMVTAQAPQQATTRAAVTAWIKQVTGYELVPENYQAITRMLEERA